MSFLTRKNTFCLDIAAAANSRPSDKDMYAFLVNVLKVPANAILEITSHHRKNQVMVSLETEEAFNAALEKLQEGVYWEKLDRTVWGWSCTKPLTTVKVVNWSIHLSLPTLKEKMARYGNVVSANLVFCKIPEAPKPISSGVVMVKLQLHDGINSIPSCIEIASAGEFLQLFSEVCEKACFKCHETGHLAAQCQKKPARARKSTTTTWARVASGGAPPLSAPLTPPVGSRQPPPHAGEKTPS